VFDTGNGFSKEDLANIFNKFYKGDKARSSKGSNSGLGLYIAKKLVELHGGNIKAYNLQDTGACIEFSLSLLPH
jgi:Histidine kinase-, DNA gyrase B-, and HSP90-like ATPase.